MKHMFFFMTGVAAGVVVGVMLGDEERKKLQDTIRKQSKTFQEEYGPKIKEGADKVVKVMQEKLIGVPSESAVRGDVKEE